MDLLTSVVLPSSFPLLVAQLSFCLSVFLAFTWSHFELNFVSVLKEMGESVQHLAGFDDNVKIFSKASQSMSRKTCFLMKFRMGFSGFYRFPFFCLSPGM